jgi:hypothetical protein
MLDTSGSSQRAESPKIGERESFGNRGIPVINPPLVALALAIAVLVALLVVVLLRRDPVDAAQGQPVTRTPVEQYSLVSVR